MEGNIRELVGEVKARNAKRVLVQVPDGLLWKTQEILDALYAAGIQAFMWLEPCYGACDLRDVEAERLGCDLLVNVGHSDFGVDEKIPTLYFIWKVDVDVMPALEKEWQKLDEYKNIGLVSSVNFLHILPAVQKFLESKGKTALIGKGSLMSGQVLGCNVSSALVIDRNVDAFLFVGSGQFHPLGIGLRLEKPFFVLDVERGEISRPDYSLFERQRYAAIAKAEEANDFAILVSTKPGQHFVDPFMMKERLEALGKRAWIFTLDLVLPERLEGVHADCYVNTACPRITVENRTAFRKPLLNPDEFAELMRNLERISQASNPAKINI